MPKARRKASTSKQENDPLHITDDICIKEEKIDEIKNEILDPDFDIAIGPISDIQLEIKKEIEEFPNDNFLIDPKDIPGIEKIVNIEDILKNNFDSTDSTNLLNSKNAESALQNTDISPSKNSSVSRAGPTPCKCMYHVKHYCIKCEKVMTYKADKTECPVCKTLLKLQCTKCSRRYKFLSSTHQYLFQYSKRLNLLSNEKKTVTFKCQKQVNFCCSVCSFKTENKEQFDQHVKTHNVKTHKVKTHDDIDDADDEFIQIYCAKCCRTKKNLSFGKNVKYGCEVCEQAMLYKCTFCKKPYKNLLNIRLHVNSKCRQRIESSKFHCNDCYFKTEDKSKLEIHIKQMHIRVACEMCKKEFVNSGAIKQHLTKGCPAGKLKDVQMNKLNSQNGKTESVIKTESTNSVPWQEEGSYQIIKYHPDDLYDEITSRPPKDLHASGWQSMIDYYCLLCDGQANKKFSKYKPRCPTCKIKYEYRCKTCEKLFAGYASIHKHVKSECPGRFSLQCTMCDFTSARKNFLINHIKNKHTVFKCLQCESRYHGYMSLRKHIGSNCKLASVNTGKYEQNLIAMYCKQCSKRVFNFEGLSVKACGKCISIMSFQCLKCIQLFDDLKTAQDHVKNECEPKFHCTQCDYKFYRQYELDGHMKLVHTSRTCPDCGVQFRDEQIFKLHRLEEIRRKNQKQKFSSKQEAKRIKLS